MEEYLKELEAAVRELPKTEKPEMWSGFNYVGGGQSQLEFLDIKIPLVRQRFKKRFSFSNLTPEKQWPIWDYIWKNSNTFETKLFCTYWVTANMDYVYAKKASSLFLWVKHIDNWAHSDEMSRHYSELFETNKKYHPCLMKWNTSKNPWERRQSLVSLNFYARFRQNPLPFNLQIKLISHLLTDSHYYVQKGIGWALRECYFFYPKETLKFIENNISKISSVAWIATTEKLDIKTKSKLKKLRSKQKGKRA